MQARTEDIDFNQAKRMCKVALDAGDLSKLQKILLPFLEQEDTSRGASENLFIYKTLGAMYRELGKHDESLMAFEQAHMHDLRDLEVLNVLVENELNKAIEQQDTSLLLEILIFHRYELKVATVVRIYQSIAAHHLARNNHEEARLAYEKALEVKPGDMNLVNALLNVSQATGNEQAIVMAREKLLATLTSPESRAAILVSMGDDYINRFDDEKRAMDAYEHALLECETSQAALERLLSLAEKREDWERALSSLASLSLFVEDRDEKIRYILKAAQLYHDRLKDKRRAVQLYNDALDIDPDNLDVFQIVVAILNELEDFIDMETNYVRMIERQQKLPKINTKILAVLCRNLGDLRLTKLNNPRGAAQAFQIVSDLFPNNVEFHARLGELYEKFDDTLHLAVKEQREVLRLAPERLEAVDALARCYRKMARFDESLTIYRVLSVLNRVDDEGRSIVEKFTSATPPKITTSFTDEHWDLLRPELLDYHLMRIFQIAVPALRESFAHDLDHYNLKEREDALTLDENSFFGRVLNNLSRPLGFGQNPKIYRYSEARGISSGYMMEPTLLVHPSMLTGRDECQITFSLAKALVLLRPEFYLLQMGSAKVIETIVYTIFKSAVPSLNIEMSKSMLSVAKMLEKNLSTVEMGTLKTIIEERIAQATNLNFRLYMEMAEDMANRVALLFSDNPHLIEPMLMEESVTISNRPIPDRVGTLLIWALSPNYTALRKKLGIDIKA